MVNDHSTDNTEAVVRSFSQDHIKIINLAEHLDGKSLNSYKKKAIEIAIGTASGDLIVTTDADCTAPPDWIKCLAAFHHRYKAAFIAAPVKIKDKPYLLSVFQSLDFITLQGITGASVHKKFHSMCNGANLAYEKKAFYEAGGFKGIDNIAFRRRHAADAQDIYPAPGAGIFPEKPVGHSEHAANAFVESIFSPARSLGQQSG